MACATMCRWANRTCRVFPYCYSLYGSIRLYGVPKKMYYSVLSLELEAMFTKC